MVTSTLGEAEMMIKEGKCGDVLFAVPLPVYDAPKMRKCRELHSIVWILFFLSLFVDLFCSVLHDRKKLRLDSLSYQM